MSDQLESLKCLPEWIEQAYGGLLMGDDLDWPAVRHDVYRFAESVGVQVEVVGNQWLIGK